MNTVALTYLRFVERWNKESDFLVQISDFTPDYEGPVRKLELEVLCRVFHGAKLAWISVVNVRVSLNTFCGFLQILLAVNYTGTIHDLILDLACLIRYQHPHLWSISLYQIYLLVSRLC